MISTLPFGTVIALDLPDSADQRQELPQSSADFRPASGVPVTLADLYPYVDKKSQKRWNKTFKLIEEWRGPADQIVLMDLFSNPTMKCFRPYLAANTAYLENSIVHHRKGLGYLRNLAASLGVQVDREYKPAWLRVMEACKAKHMTAHPEILEAKFDSPEEVTPEDVQAVTTELIRTHQKRESGARKSQVIFLGVLRDCGYVAKQPFASARQDDFAVPEDDLPEPLRSEVASLRVWMKTGTQIRDGWTRGWRTRGSKLLKQYEGIRDVTAESVVGGICRTYGYLANIEKDAEGINSLATLYQLPIAACYGDWSLDFRKLSPGSVRVGFGAVFSALRYFPHATSPIDLSWTSDFISSLPKYDRNERNARKLLRMVSFHMLETVPEKLRRERNQLIARHKRAEAAEAKRRKKGQETSTDKKILKARATRLTRIAVLAQQELLIEWLLALAWRNENLRGCRLEEIDGKPANLYPVKACDAIGMDLPDWVIELQKHDPEAEVWVFSFSKDETKADRPVRAVVPRHLVKLLLEFRDVYRPILACDSNPRTLFVNQKGGAMKAQQIEEAVEEATLRYAGKAVNPHLFRDIYALEFLKCHNADYLTLAKILWHKNHLVTVLTYSWMYDESVGTNAAGEWSEERQQKRRLRMNNSIAAARNAGTPSMNAAEEWSDARRKALHISAPTA